MRQDTANRIVLLIMASFFPVIFFVGGYEVSRLKVEAVDCDEIHWPYVIPTPTELQVFLEVTPDGVIGKKTLEKWEEYINNQRALKWMSHE